ncbi:Pyridoxine kinase [bioreactor metagenome]|uniref:PN/PL/PM kinase n=1 Tax=bioreactor metagenome TaxID=1076179 RepID=A0A644VDR4_9ZZZZ
MNNTMYKAMTIAGSDTSGGAGMEADLKTMQELGVYGMVALTVIVAQNPQNNWSHDIFPISLDVIEKQLNTIVDGIGVDAMKTGMLGSADLVELVAKTIDKNHLKNVVIDPVMVCKGVDAIMVPEAAAATKKLLVSRADVITPNLLEAAYLTDMPSVGNLDEMKEAAGRVIEMGAKFVVIKAGERLPGENAVDVLYDGKEFTISTAPKIPGSFNNGAGCTFSAAITACLAKGMNMEDTMTLTKKFMTAALKGSFRINKWAGATRHIAFRESN